MKSRIIKCKGCFKNAVPDQDEICDTCNREVNHYIALKVQEYAEGKHTTKVKGGTLSRNSFNKRNFLD